METPKIPIGEEICPALHGGNCALMFCIKLGLKGRRKRLITQCRCIGSYWGGGRSSGRRVCLRCNAWNEAGIYTSICRVTCSCQLFLLQEESKLLVIQCPFNRVARGNRAHIAGRFPLLMGGRRANEAFFHVLHPRSKRGIGTRLLFALNVWKWDGRCAFLYVAPRGFLWSSRCQRKSWTGSGYGSVDSCHDAGWSGTREYASDWRNRICRFVLFIAAGMNEANNICHPAGDVVVVK